jgi:hypothetical protein
MESMHQSNSDSTRLVVGMSFGFRGKAIDPDVISQTLGLSPSRFVRAGDLHQLRDGRTVKRPWTVWAIDSASKVQSQDLDDHASYLLGLLADRESKIREIRQQTEYCDLRVWYETSEPAASFRISAKLMSRLVDLVDDLNFSVITSTDDAVTAKECTPTETPAN